MKPFRSRSRRGFTLLEMVAVMFLMSLSLVLLTSVLIGAIRTQKLTSTTTTRLLNQSAVVDQFRSDVAKAISAPKSFDKFKADATTMILQLDKDKHLVYRWEDEQLKRLDIGKDTKTSLLPLGDDRMSVDFQRVDDDRTLILRIIETMPHSGLKQYLVIKANRGGDLR